MKRFLGIPRKWIGAAFVIALAAGLTVPWTIWILFAAYQRDVNEKVAKLADRIRLQLEVGAPLATALTTEANGDDTVQVVMYFNYLNGTWLAAKHNESPAPSPGS